MSIDSALIVQRDRIPNTQTVAEAIRGYGHDVLFPEDFEFGVRDEGLWRDVLFDGDQAGFDYVLSGLSDWEDDDVVTFPRNVGDTILEFGARGNASIKLVAHVQRAICELSKARGWIDCELVSTKRMIADCKDTADNWDAIAAKLEADLAAMPKPPPPSPLTIADRWQKWLGDGGWYTLLGCVLGVLYVTYRLIVK